MAKLIRLNGAGASGPAGGGSTPGSLQITFAGSLAYQNAPFGASFIATGGVQPYAFSLTAGALPPGLSLNASTGLISGTPTTQGTYSFTGEVTDSASTTASVSVSITVRQALLGDFTIGTLTSSWTSKSPGLLE